MAELQFTPAVANPRGFLALREFWKQFSKNRGAVAAGCLLLILLVIAVFAPWLAPHSPIEQYREAVKIPPAWLAGGSWHFVFGTDEAGRDILSRLMFGARLSLFIGFVSVVLALIPGIVLGLIAAFFAKWTDAPIMRGMDVLLALPSLLLAVAVVAVLGPRLGAGRIAKGLCHGLACGGRRLAAFDVFAGLAELRGAADRAGHAGIFDGDPRRCGARLSRAWSPAAQRGMGRDAGFGARLYR